MLIYILGVCEAKVSQGHDFGSVCFYLILPLKLSLAQSCLTCCSSMDCSPPGFSVHGIFPARILESGLPFPTLRDLPDPGIKLHPVCLLHSRWILPWREQFLGHGPTINNKRESGGHLLARTPSEEMIAWSVLFLGSPPLSGSSWLKDGKEQHFTILLSPMMAISTIHIINEFPLLSTQWIPQGFPSSQRVWGRGNILSHVAFGTRLRTGEATHFCRRNMPEGPNLAPPCLKVLRLKEASVSMLQCNAPLDTEGHKLKVYESLHCPESPAWSQLFAVLIMCS